MPFLLTLDEKINTKWWDVNAIYVNAISIDSIWKNKHKLMKCYLEENELPKCNNCTSKQISGIRSKNRYILPAVLNWSENSWEFKHTGIK